MLVENTIRTNLQHSSQPIFSSFLRNAAITPDATAIIYQDGSLSYAEIEHKSRITAYKIWDSGVRPDDHVSILAERGPHLVWTMIAVLRLGAVFSVLDSSYPKGRLLSLAKIWPPRLIVSAGDPSLSDLLESLGQDAGIETLDLTAHGALHCDAPNEVRLDAVNPDHPAYIVFTSGSTGKPKAVLSSHVPLTHFIAWHSLTFQLQSSDRFTMLSGLSHDPILRDIFTPLSLGATLVIPTQAEILAPGALRLWFSHMRANVAHLTPAMGQLLAAGTEQSPTLPNLRHLFWGGDKLTAKLVDQIWRIAENTSQTNFYGCSETPQAVAFSRIAKGAVRTDMPIGQAVDDFELTIVDDDQRPLSQTNPGQIVVASRYLSLGYVEDGRIVPLAKTQGNLSGLPYYRTGDRGFVGTDNNIYLVGRADDQIKIRGFRVELSEISSALSEHPSVVSALALPVDRHAAPRIVAFVAIAEGHRTSVDELQSFLSSRLPAYMVPGRVLLFDRVLPLLPNGKPDRQKLLSYAESEALAPQPHNSSSANQATAGSTTEKQLIDGWKNAFNGLPINKNDSFVTLGGDSLSYVEAFIETEKVLGTVPADWHEMTIAQLAASCASASASARRNFSSVDGYMLARAISITLIVAYHFGLTSLGDGFTGALFVISGYLFGDMSLRQTFRDGNRRRLLGPIWNILPVTALFVSVYTLIDLARGTNPSLAMLTFNADLVDYYNMNIANGAIIRHQGVFWYVNALLKIIVLVFLATCVVTRKAVNGAHLGRFCISLFLLGCGLKFVLPAILDSDFLKYGTPDLSLFQVSVVGNLATFMLGAMLATSSRASAGLVGSLALAYALADAKFYGAYNAVSIIAACVVLLKFKRVPMPKLMSSAVLCISGASLFIYLSNLFIGVAVGKLLGMPQPLVQTACAIAGGILLNAGWTRLRQKVGNVWNTMSQAEPLYSEAVARAD